MSRKDELLNLLKDELKGNFLAASSLEENRLFIDIKKEALVETANQLCGPFSYPCLELNIHPFHFFLVGSDLCDVVKNLQLRYTSVVIDNRNAYHFTDAATFFEPAFPSCRLTRRSTVDSAPGTRSFESLKELKTLLILYETILLNQCGIRVIDVIALVYHVNAFGNVVQNFMKLLSFYLELPLGIFLIGNVPGKNRYPFS